MSETMLNPWIPPLFSDLKHNMRQCADYSFGRKGTIKTRDELNRCFWTLLNFNPPIFGAQGVETGYRSEGDLQTYTPDAVSVVDNELLITASKGTNEIWSGLIRSKKTWRYGLFEACLWMPEAAGMIPQFWLYTNDPTAAGGNDNEIDIHEHLNNPARSIDGHWSWGNCKGPGAGIPLFDLRTGTQLNANNFPTGSYLYHHPEYDITEGYHLYQCAWVPGYVVMYRDNRPFVTFVHPWKTVWGQRAPEAGITLNFAVGISGDNFAGTPTGNDYPAVLRCSYIKVWQ